jgi:hypothetical protein
VSIEWSVMSGDLNLLRISTRSADEDGCPAQRAARALPAVRPARRPRAGRKYLDDFALGAVMDALDRVEFGGMTCERAVEQVRRSAKPPLHGGAVTWIRHAVESYRANEVLAESPATVPVEPLWVSQRAAGGKTWELWAWGRRYASQDGTIRECRLLRYRTARERHASTGAPAEESAAAGEAGTKRERKRDRSRTAIAAYVAAFGVPAPRPGRREWGEPFQPLPGGHPDVQWVRVVEVGLDGGEPAIVFSGTPAEAKALFDRDALDLVREIRSGGRQQPGRDCADCKLLTACDALPRIPGILGITAPEAPLRTLSATDLRYYSKCPAMEHLCRLHLPRHAEYGPAAQRGQAVHAWLAGNHGRADHVACTTSDVPPRPDDWGAGNWPVTGEQAVMGSQMLAHHAGVCPLRRGSQDGDAAGTAGIRVEPSLAFHDTAANVIVVAAPDLLYLDDGGWVWREVKTSEKPLRSTADLFRVFPQLALATVLLAENALGGNPERARVELEVLTPAAADLLYMDPGDPDDVARARQEVLRLAGPWHGDRAAPARPGKQCGNCPVSRWCPEGRSVQAGAAA